MFTCFIISRWQFKFFCLFIWLSDLAWSFVLTRAVILLYCLVILNNLKTFFFEICLFFNYFDNKLTCEQTCNWHFEKWNDVRSLNKHIFYKRNNLAKPVVRFYLFRYYPMDKIGEKLICKKIWRWTLRNLWSIKKKKKNYSTDTGTRVYPNRFQQVFLFEDLLCVTYENRLTSPDDYLVTKKKNVLHLEHYSFTPNVV